MVVCSECNKHYSCVSGEFAYVSAGPPRHAAHDGDAGSMHPASRKICASVLPFSLRVCKAVCTTAAAAASENQGICVSIQSDQKAATGCCTLVTRS
jgi:hypothetical protein